MTLARGIFVALLGVSVVGASPPDQPACDIQELSRTVELLVKDYGHVFDRFEIRIEYLENKVAQLERDNEALRLEIAAARVAGPRQSDIANAISRETLVRAVAFAWDGVRELKGHLDAVLLERLAAEEDRWMPMLENVERALARWCADSPAATDAAAAIAEAGPAPAIEAGSVPAATIEPSAFRDVVEPGGPPPEPERSVATESGAYETVAPSSGLTEPSPDTASVEAPPVPDGIEASRLLEAFLNPWAAESPLVAAPSDALDLEESMAEPTIEAPPERLPDRETIDGAAEAVPPLPAEPPRPPEPLDLMRLQNAL
jgi:hypothetical protein